MMSWIKKYAQNIKEFLLQSTKLSGFVSNFKNVKNRCILKHAYFSQFFYKSRGQLKVENKSDQRKLYFQLLADLTHGICQRINLHVLYNEILIQELSSSSLLCVQLTLVGNIKRQLKINRCFGF